jgi:CheY-like chemotaxis protein
MIERNFRHEAERRKLTFSVEIEPGIGRAVNTDPKRLLQVLKNLLSNAFKFTEHGNVNLKVGLAWGGWAPDHPVLSKAPTVVAFQVSDTGIGIPVEKQRIIFEAFQQADAGTSRKYGGTGLGLAISRELANLLGGEIRLSSVPGSGSTFVLYLPLSYSGPARTKPPAANEPISADSQLPRLPSGSSRPEEIPDDRDILEPGEPTLLIVDDDPHYAKVLLDLARQHGFKGLVATRGTEAITLARKYLPTAISLDIFLPDVLGWTVLSRLKQDATTRHIPVQIVTIEEERQLGLERGAFAFLNKPITTEGIEHALDRIKQFTTMPARRLLVVEDNDAERLGIVELLAHDDLTITSVPTGEEALRVLREQGADCMVLDLKLPDMTGFELLDRLQAEEGLRDIPVVVFTGKELSNEEEQQLKKVAKSIVIKGVQSPERLLDETALFLHRVIADLPPGKQRMLERLHETDEALVGKKVLVVDDDVRNIFALSSVLERHGIQVLSASTGQEAVSLLEREQDPTLVLMDIMMPEMDGYETMRVIRSIPRFRSMPIIALTAKAMKGDREKCLEAGASDYIAKPVNTDQLLGLLRQWLHR